MMLTQIALTLSASEQAGIRYGDMPQIAHEYGFRIIRCWPDSPHGFKYLVGHSDPIAWPPYLLELKVAHFAHELD